MAHAVSAGPVVIIGAGLSGAAAAWALTRRGVPVVVLEQFGPGHREGSSHGSARIVRRVYRDELYLRLTGRAFELWREVEAAAGVEVLRLLGGLDFGAARDVGAIAELLAATAVEHEVLPAAAAAERWPGMIFDGDVLFHPQAGVLDADAAVGALLDLAVAGGAQVRYATTATVASGRRVQAADAAGGSVIDARAVVVAAGGWLAPLLDGPLGLALPPLTVTEQPVCHYPRRDSGAPPWPSVIHETGTGAVYHLAGGRDGGPGDDRKLGLHDAGPVTTAATRTGRIDPQAAADANAYVRRWLPGLVPEPSSATTCLYTRTPSEDFVLDRIEDLVVCSPCSGHGAKFAPLIGELIADLVLGTGARVPSRFRLAAHRGTPARPVSL